MIGRVLGTLAVWIIVAFFIVIFLIFLGGACWVTLSIWKAVFGFFV